jgi:hypothetical protein
VVFGAGIAERVMATNLLVLTCSIFLAGQIAWIYKAPVDPVTVDSPLSGE